MNVQLNHDVKIEALGYNPPSPYLYDLEIFSFSELKKRTPEGRIDINHRYKFYMVICVTQGECTQSIDFEPVLCKSGTLFVVSPNQVHNFGKDEDWEGWIILFRSEFLIPRSSTLNEHKLAFDIERLPKVLTLTNTELDRAVYSIARMIEDSLISEPTEDVHMLLRYQLYTLMTWLHILHKNTLPITYTQLSQRFIHFHKLVETHFAEWSHVSEYAHYLNCTEKTLTRASIEATGMTAKAFISARMILEAKRLLVHTDQSVSHISEHLNFKEATHFSKFFKRETGYTPSDFREQAIEW